MPSKDGTRAGGGEGVTAEEGGGDEATRPGRGKPKGASEELGTVEIK